MQFFINDNMLDNVKAYILLDEKLDVAISFLIQDEVIYNVYATYKQKDEICNSGYKRIEEYEIFFDKKILNNFKKAIEEIIKNLDISSSRVVKSYIILKKIEEKIKDR